MRLIGKSLFYLLIFGAILNFFTEDEARPIADKSSSGKVMLSKTDSTLAKPHVETEALLSVDSAKLAKVIEPDQSVSNASFAPPERLALNMNHQYPAMLRILGILAISDVSG